MTMFLGDQHVDQRQLAEGILVVVGQLVDQAVVGGDVAMRADEEQARAVLAEVAEPGADVLQVFDEARFAFLVVGDDAVDAEQVEDEVGVVDQLLPFLVRVLAAGQVEGALEVEMQLLDLEAPRRHLGLVDGLQDSLGDAADAEEGAEMRLADAALTEDGDFIALPARGDLTPAQRDAQRDRGEQRDGDGGDTEHGLSRPRSAAPRIAPRASVGAGRGQGGLDVALDGAVALAAARLERRVVVHFEACAAGDDQPRFL
ncbi:MAG: hypothetical protein MO853_08555 [Candidatus Protistobacter heckmanni]|nr:hypothetical protein [Candidatus Protistobacter heckmanni]